MNVENWWNDNCQWKGEVLRANLSEFHFLQYESHYTALVLKPGLCGEKPLANCLSCDNAICLQLYTRMGVHSCSVSQCMSKLFSKTVLCIDAIMINTNTDLC
jgi:hypothetical protein